MRQGASTVPASDAAILNMIKETGGDSYEAARSLNQQLTFTWTSDFFKKRGLEFGKQQMRTLHLVGEDGTYTNLAFLLSEQCTHAIKLAVFEGSKKAVFYRLKLIEAYGTGILKINECYADSAVKPSIVTASNSFKIILPNINYGKENHDGKEEIKKYECAMLVGIKKDEQRRMRAVIALCQKNGFVVRKDIESALHISQSTAILLLREMTAKGILVKRGAARNLRYYLSDK